MLIFQGAMRGSVESQILVISCNIIGWGVPGN